MADFFADMLVNGTFIYLFVVIILAFITASFNKLLGFISGLVLILNGVYMNGLVNQGSIGMWSVIVSMVAGVVLVYQGWTDG